MTKNYQKIDKQLQVSESKVQTHTYSRTQIEASITLLEEELASMRMLLAKADEFEVTE